MKRLLIEIGNPVGFLDSGNTEFKIRIEIDTLTKDMIKDVINSLEKALLNEVE